MTNSVLNKSVALKTGPMHKKHQKNWISSDHTGTESVVTTQAHTD